MSPVAIGWTFRPWKDMGAVPPEDWNASGMDALQRVESEAPLPAAGPTGLLKTLGWVSVVVAAVGFMVGLGLAGSPRMNVVGVLVLLLALGLGAVGAVQLRYVANESRIRSRRAYVRAKDEADRREQMSRARVQEWNRLRDQSQQDHVALWEFALVPQEGVRLADIVGGTVGGVSTLVQFWAARAVSAGQRVLLVDLTEAVIAYETVNNPEDVDLDESRVSVVVWPECSATHDPFCGLPSADTLLGNLFGSFVDSREHELVGFVTTVARVLHANDVQPSLANVMAACNMLIALNAPERLRGTLKTMKAEFRSKKYAWTNLAKKVISIAESRMGLKGGQFHGDETLDQSWIWNSEDLGEHLRVVAFKGADGAAEDHMAALINSLCRSLEKANPPESDWDLVFLLGAERLGSDVLEGLTDRFGERLVTWFRSPTATFKESSSAATTLIGRIGNAGSNGAGAVLEELGTVEYWDLSSQSEAVGENYAQALGENNARSYGTGGGSNTEGESLTRTWGESRTRTMELQKKEAPQPKIGQLQTLPPTQFIVLSREVRNQLKPTSHDDALPGRPVLPVVDCNPGLPASNPTVTLEEQRRESPGVLTT